MCPFLFLAFIVIVFQEEALANPHIQNACHGRNGKLIPNQKKKKKKTKQAVLHNGALIVPIKIDFMSEAETNAVSNEQFCPKWNVTNCGFDKTKDCSLFYCCFNASFKQALFHIIILQAFAYTADKCRINLNIGTQKYTVIA